VKKKQIFLKNSENIRDHSFRKTYTTNLKNKESENSKVKSKFIIGCIKR